MASKNPELYMFMDLSHLRPIYKNFNRVFNRMFGLHAVHFWLDEDMKGGMRNQVKIWAKSWVLFHPNLDTLPPPTSHDMVPVLLGLAQV